MKENQWGIKISVSLIQGGILSPILFNLYMMSLGRSLTQIARIVQIADNYAIYIAAPALITIEATLELALDKIEFLVRRELYDDSK